MNNKYPPILDACCGGKMFYFDKDNENVLFQDIRNFTTILCDGRTFKVQPDVVADFRDMPYPDNTFEMVVFDPPHLLRNIKGCSFNDIYGENATAKPKGYQEIKYGSLGNTDWEETLKQGFDECFRVLKCGGFLLFKWNETDKKVSEILKLSPYPPLLGNRCGKSSRTHWIIFRKPEYA